MADQIHYKPRQLIFHFNKLPDKKLIKEVVPSIQTFQHFSLVDLKMTSTVTSSWTNNKQKCIGTM